MATEKINAEKKTLKFYASATKQIFPSFKSMDKFVCTKVKQTDDFTDSTTGEVSEVYFVYGEPLNEQRLKECVKNEVYPKFKMYGKPNFNIGDIFMVQLNSKETRFMLVNGELE